MLTLLHLLCHFGAGLLRVTISLGRLFCAGVFRGCPRPSHEAAEIRAQLYLWIHYLHGELCHYEGAQGAFDEHDCGRSVVIHDNLLGQYVYDAVFDMYQGWTQGLRAGLDCERCAVGSLALVSDLVFAWRHDGAQHCHASNMYHAAAGDCRVHANARNVRCSMCSLLCKVIVLTRFGNAAAFQLTK